MGISFLIPTHNRVEQLERALESIRVQRNKSGVPVEVLVVANGCTDETISTVERLAQDFPFELRVVDEKTLGLNSARNRACLEAQQDIFAFLDDDVILSGGYLDALVDLYANHPTDLGGGKTELFWEVVEKPDWFPDRLLNLLSCKDHGNQVVELLTKNDVLGANFSIHRRVYEKTGPFKLGLDRTGDLLLGGGETEFISRALRDGFRMFYAPGCHLKHWVAPGRVSLKYLAGVAHGTAMSYIFARESFSPMQIAKWTLYHSAQCAKHTIKLKVQDSEAILLASSTV
jgi:glycosyltransferase involved in cell wall biosynthesis